MTLIKFDLPLNGTKVRNLDELKENITSEIVTLARSGQLGRWFKSRRLESLVEATAGLVIVHAPCFFMPPPRPSPAGGGG